MGKAWGMMVDFIHRWKDNEIIRPIAFKPVQNGGSKAEPRGRSAEKPVSTLSSPEAPRRPLYSDPDGTYSDTGSSLYGLPRVSHRPLTTSSPARSRPSEANSAYSSPGAPVSRPRPIYHAATEPLYGNLSNFALKPSSVPTTSQGTMMGTGFAIPTTATAKDTSGSKSDQYDSVPDILRQFEAKESPVPKPRRFPSEPCVNDPKVTVEPLPPLISLNSNAASRLAFYGTPQFEAKESPVPKPRRFPSEPCVNDPKVTVEPPPPLISLNSNAASRLASYGTPQFEAKESPVPKPRRFPSEPCVNDPKFEAKESPVPKPRRFPSEPCVNDPKVTVEPPPPLTSLNSNAASRLASYGTPQFEAKESPVPKPRRFPSEPCVNDPKVTVEPPPPLTSLNSNAASRLASYGTPQFEAKESPVPKPRRFPSEPCVNDPKVTVEPPPPLTSLNSNAASRLASYGTPQFEAKESPVPKPRRFPSKPRVNDPEVTVEPPPPLTSLNSNAASRLASYGTPQFEAKESPVPKPRRFPSEPRVNDPKVTVEPPPPLTSLNSNAASRLASYGTPQFEAKESPVPKPRRFPSKPRVNDPKVTVEPPPPLTSLNSNAASRLASYGTPQFEAKESPVPKPRRFPSKPRVNDPKVTVEPPPPLTSLNSNAASRLASYGTPQFEAKESPVPKPRRFPSEPRVNDPKVTVEPPPPLTSLNSNAASRLASYGTPQFEAKESPVPKPRRFPSKPRVNDPKVTVEPPPPLTSLNSNAASRLASYGTPQFEAKESPVPKPRRFPSKPRVNDPKVTVEPPPPLTSLNSNAASRLASYGTPQFEAKESPVPKPRRFPSEPRVNDPKVTVEPPPPLTSLNSNAASRLASYGTPQFEAKESPVPKPRRFPSKPRVNDPKVTVEPPPPLTSLNSNAASRLASYGTPQFEAKESPVPKPRRFPSKPRVNDPKVTVEPPPPLTSLNSNAASRLASYGMEPVVSSSQGNGSYGGTNGSHGSRHSSGVHGVTPSPSDSGVVELEAALRTKEEELGELRAAMEANEAVVVRVYQEKEAKWQAKLAEWAARLETSIGTEQKLLSQVQRLQEEKTSVSRQLHTLTAEKAALQRKMRELEEALSSGRSSRSESVCRKCGDHVAQEQREQQQSHHLHTNGGLRPSHSPTPAEEIRGEVDVLRREVNELRNSLTGQIQQYSNERQRWDEEKAKVVSYQKLLQNNYVSVFERNKKLESIIRANKISGATSGEDSEGELRRLVSESPTSPDRRGDLDLDRLDFSTV